MDLNNTGKRSKLANSRIIRMFKSFGSFVEKSFSESFLHFLLYEKRDRSSGAVSYLFDRINFKHRVSIPVKRFFSRQTESSAAVNFVRKCAENIKRIQLKTVGAFLFTYGVCCSVSYLLRNAADVLSAISREYLTVGIVCAVIGAVFSTSSSSCSDAVNKSRILSFVLFDVIGFEKNENAEDALNTHGNIAVIFGIFFGLTATLTTPFIVPVGLPFVALCYSVLCVPEAGVVILLLSFPFVDIVCMKFIVSAVTVAWLLKLLRGKRVLSLNTLDVSVLCFSVMILIGSGISLTPAASIKAAADCSLMMSGYFICVNLVRTGKWVDKCTSAAVFSVSSVVTVYMLDRIISILAPDSTIYEIFLSLPLINAILSLSDVTVAIIAVLLLPLIIEKIELAASADSRFGLFCLLAVSVAATVFVGSRAGVAAGIVSALFGIALCGRYAFGKAMLAVFFSALVLTIIPYGIGDKIISFFTMPQQANVLVRSAGETTSNMLSDCFGGGIGFGKDAFAAAYPLYSTVSSDTSSSTCNLYTQITVSLGLVAFLLFILIIILYIRHYFSYRSYSPYCSERVNYTAAAAFSGTVGFLFCGAFEYVWFDLRVFALFWITLGLCSAAVRTGVREKISAPLPDGPYAEFRI